jgi:phage N-6-adenine-methyltransferase
VGPGWREAVLKTDWKTPVMLFAALDSEFHFSVDVCASPWNAQCEKYFTIENNGLSQEWNGVCWCNPPFDESQKLWVRKAWEEAQRGCTVAVIIPGNYHDSEWWHKYALRASEIRYMRGRARFLNEEGKETSMRTILLIFRPYSQGPPVVKSIDRNGWPLDR